MVLSTCRGRAPRRKVMCISVPQTVLLLEFASSAYRCLELEDRSMPPLPCGESLRPRHLVSTKRGPTWCIRILTEAGRGWMIVFPLPACCEIEAALIACLDRLAEGSSRLARWEGPMDCGLCGCHGVGEDERTCGQLGVQNVCASSLLMLMSSVEGRKLEGRCVLVVGVEDQPNE